ncbi:MAG: hypothetical protein V3W41_22690 [Planctomycetota bacterium]
MRVSTTLVLLFSLTASLSAQSAQGDATKQNDRALQGQSFAAPVELTAGGKAISNLMYPSPVLHDLDGDGKRELVLGEIFGTVRACTASADGLKWQKQVLLQAEGEKLKFNNW